MNDVKKEKPKWYNTWRIVPTVMLGIVALYFLISFLAYGLPDMIEQRRLEREADRRIYEALREMQYFLEDLRDGK